MKAILQVALLVLVLYVVATAPHASAELVRDGGHAAQSVGAGVRQVVEQLSGQKG